MPQPASASRTSTRSWSADGHANPLRVALAGDAYHATHSASVNLMWQIRKRLSVGLEELYGRKTTNDGADGDVFRTRLGLVYSMF